MRFDVLCWILGVVFGVVWRVIFYVGLEGDFFVCPMFLM